MSETLSDDFFASYAKQMREEEESKKNNGGFEPQEYEEIGYCGLKSGISKIIRLVGAPIGSEKMGYKRQPTDAKEILQCEVKDDEGKRFTIKLPLPNYQDKNDNHLLTRLVLKVTEGTYVNKKLVHQNETKYPELWELVNKGGYTKDDGNSYTWGSGFKGIRVSIYNVIDREDDWCKNNKHTKILCRDLNIDDQNRVWAKPGIKSNGSINRITEVISKDGNFEKYDIAIKRTGQKDNPFVVVNASKMKDKDMLEEITNNDGSSVDEKLIVVGPLTAEEKNYERYDLDKLYQPTSYRKLLKRVPKVFKLCDACLGTNFYAELEVLAKKEQEEWDKINAEKEAEQEAAEHAAIEKAAGVTEEEAKEIYDNDPLGPDAVFGAPAETPKAEEPAPTRRRAASTSVPPYVALLKGYDNLTAELKARIVDAKQEGDKVVITWDRKDDCLECDTCGAMSPESATHCPVCGVQF